jgi:hypothetical protein
MPAARGFVLWQFDQTRTFMATIGCQERRGVVRVGSEVSILKTIAVSGARPFHNSNGHDALRRIATNAAAGFDLKNRLSRTWRAIQIVQNANDNRRMELRGNHCKGNRVIAKRRRPASDVVDALLAATR